MSGWTLKRIQHEAHRRAWAGYGDESTYHPIRDGRREQDWEWAVDRCSRRLEISASQSRAAHAYYEAKQTLLGDEAHDPRSMPLGGGEDRYERAARISSGGLSYVMNHPDLTAARRRTFDQLFQSRQPSLEDMRRRAGGKRTNQREEIDRIRWCCEVLANHFDGQDYEEGAVNEKHMGVGEGWAPFGHVSQFPAGYVESLQARGLQVFAAPTGNIYARDPKQISVFEPLDATPQITASKM